MTSSRKKVCFRVGKTKKPSKYKIINFSKIYNKTYLYYARQKFKFCNCPLIFHIIVLYFSQATIKNNH